MALYKDIKAAVISKAGNILQFDTAVSPEQLTLNVDSNTAGGQGTWKWTWERSALPFARRQVENQAFQVVPLYKQGTYVINNFANEIHDEMTQTHSFKLKWVEGAGDDNLVSWVTYSNANASNPAINGGATTNVARLAVSVPSTITLPALVNPEITYVVTNNAAGAYSFSANAQGDNQTLGPLYRGGTYIFKVDASGHPFYITTDNGTGFIAGEYVGEFTSNVSNSRTQSGTVVFNVGADAPDTLYYQCANHGSMRGSMRIKDLEVEVNAQNNYVIYGQHSQELHAQKMEIRPLPELASQMCLVYDAVSGKWGAQDLATYVENTPSFEDKIKDVAGTATLVAPDGTSLVASVEIYSTESYLPQLDNTDGDIAFAQDTESLYIWKTNQWLKAGAVPPTSNSSVQLSQAGTLSLTTGTARWHAPFNISVSNVVARVGTAPSGSDLTVKLKRNGVANSVITVSDGSTIGSNATAITVSEGDYFTVDVTAIGSSTAGADLNVTIKYTE
jgi:hypothetical protein